MGPMERQNPLIEVWWGKVTGSIDATTNTNCNVRIALWHE